MDLRKFPVSHKPELLQWIEQTRAEVFSRQDRGKGKYFFLIPSSPQARAVEFFLGSDDSLSRKVVSLREYTRDQRFVRVGIVELEGETERVVLKSVREWGVKYVLKHFFRYGRVFRGAMATTRLTQAGLLTPQVKAVGEKRSGLKLKTEYLMSSFETGVEDLYSFLLQCDEAQIAPQLEGFLPAIAEIAARMHLAGVAHTDLNASNIYFFQGQEGGKRRYGVWDLTDARLFSQGVPGEWVDKDLRCGLRSVWSLCAARGVDKRLWPDPLKMTSLLLEEYARLMRSLQGNGPFHLPEKNWIVESLREIFETQ